MKFNKGFTLVEMLVSTGIMVLIMTVIFAGYPRFKARSTLGAAAREIALLVRETQVFGLAVKSFSSSEEIYPPYGVHLSANDKREIIMFADLPPGSGLYESGDGCGTEVTECVKRLSLSGAVEIGKFCVIAGAGSANSGTEICSNDSPGISQLNITFRRPDPEAVIIVDDNAEVYNGANIYLHSSREPSEARVVRVWVTGQISIQ
jgi:prepilin-type N-terminal cleavage/methylation domain-containing protein